MVEWQHALATIPAVAITPIVLRFIILFCPCWYAEPWISYAKSCRDSRNRGESGTSQELASVNRGLQFTNSLCTFWYTKRRQISNIRFHRSNVSTAIGSFAAISYVNLQEIQIYIHLVSQVSESTGFMCNFQFILFLIKVTKISN